MWKGDCAPLERSSSSGFSAQPAQSSGWVTAALPLGATWSSMVEMNQLPPELDWTVVPLPQSDPHQQGGAMRTSACGSQVASLQSLVSRWSWYRSGHVSPEGQSGLSVLPLETSLHVGRVVWLRCFLLDCIRLQVPFVPLASPPHLPLCQPGDSTAPCEAGGQSPHHSCPWPWTVDWSEACSRHYHAERRSFLD